MLPRAIFCPTTMIAPVLLARRWTRTGSADGRGGGPVGRTPRRPLTCPEDKGFLRVRSKFAGGQVVEHQGGGLDPDADPAAAEDRRGEQLAPGQPGSPHIVLQPISHQLDAGRLMVIGATVALAMM